MCSGLTNSREKDNSYVNPSLGCLEVNQLRPKVSSNNNDLFLCMCVCACMCA